MLCESGKYQQQSRDSMFTNPDTMLSVSCFSENFNIAKIEFFFSCTNRVPAQFIPQIQRLLSFGTHLRMHGNLCSFFLTYFVANDNSETYLEPCEISMMELFSPKSFIRCLTGFLNTPLNSIYYMILISDNKSISVKSIAAVIKITNFWASDIYRIKHNGQR